MSESMIQMQRKLADVTSKLENAEGELAEAQATLAKLRQQKPAVIITGEYSKEYSMALLPRKEFPIGTKLYTAPVPAVAAPAVQDDCVSQDESTMMMAASALVLYRAGESAEYMAKAIEALLQSDEGCSSQDQNGDGK